LTTKVERRSLGLETRTEAPQIRDPG